MNQPPNAVNELELLLMRVMIALVVRDPDGWYRIQRALYSVQEAGADMSEEEIPALH